MSIKLEPPNITELKPRIAVIGVGGAGGNAINNMIASGVSGVEFIVCNTDAQALAMSSAETVVQLGQNLTEGLGAGAKPEIGEGAAEEALDEIRSQLSGAHMVFVAAGMGGGTGTGAAPVIARAAHDLEILTVGVVTKPFHFEGNRRMRTAEKGIEELAKFVDTLIVIPNQNLFRIATEKTTFSEAFIMADQVLHSGIACITDLIVREGLINLDFADVRAIMLNMGTAMMGTGEAAGERRALEAAEAAISNPLLDEISMKGAKGLLVSISGAPNMTLYEVDEAASRVREEVDAEANIIVGATFDEALDDKLRVSIVASGLPSASAAVAGDGVGAEVPDGESAPRGRNETPPTSGPATPPPVQPATGQSIAAGTSRPTPESTSATFVDPDDDVTIVLGPPKLLGTATSKPQAGNPTPEPVGNAGKPAFTPAPPAAIPQSKTRVPGLDAFPEHARREYEAKSAGHAPQTPVQQKRASLFERLTGRKPDAQEAPKTESLAPVSPGQAQRMPPAGGEFDHKSASYNPTGNPYATRGAERQTRKNPDIPAFFAKEGRGGGRR